MIVIIHRFVMPKVPYIYRMKCIGGWSDNNNIHIQPIPYLVPEDWVHLSYLVRLGRFVRSRQIYLYWRNVYTFTEFKIHSRPTFKVSEDGQ